MLFTEIDHDFINPTTLKYKKEYSMFFTPSKWDKKSGYAEHKYATFNEYMTWAVYDLFIQKYFPDLAGKESKEWHEVNESRGFFASTIFAEKLADLYKTKGPDKKIKDLFPDLLKWCKDVENDLESLTSK